MSYAKIHLDVPLNGPFDYRTNGLSVVKGSLVEVPFRNKKQVGIVIDVSENTNVETRRISYTCVRRSGLSEQAIDSLDKDQWLGNTAEALS